jgi:phosphoserine phosphatase RsbU/P
MFNEIPGETASEVDEVLHTLSHESGMPTILLAQIDHAVWSARAVRDGAHFGFSVGHSMDAELTLCEVVRRTDEGIAIDDAGHDDRFRHHPACERGGVAAYIGVPLRLSNGGFLGTLCALDRAPHVGLEAALSLYRLFARLLSHELELLHAERTTRVALTTETEAGMSRERFLAAVAHDLRTPLAAIRASAQLLQRHPDQTDAVMDGVSRVLYASERMERLVNDLLDLSRGRLGGGIPVQRTAIRSVNDFVTTVLGEVGLAHARHDIRSDVHIATREVYWDRDRIAQCIDNLVTNACVHGASGTPVHVVARGDDTAVTIEVSNSGEVPLSERNSLFDPFHGSGRRGLGLGLFIADQIVRAHGGTITVESTNGRTVTCIRLPAGLPH